MPDTAPLTTDAPGTPVPLPTLRQALAQAQQRGLDRLEAEMLLLHALGHTTEHSGSTRAWLLAHDDETLAPAAQQRLQNAIERRCQGEPVAYITGSKAFYGLTLQVDARVLDPRADTETLVDWAIDTMNRLEPRQQGSAGPESPALLDLGTGSGAIALALQQARPHWQVHALERSPEALSVAQANAAQLQLAVHFHQGNWLDGMQQRFDLIVSNPPYIASHDTHLAALTHEPLQALVSGSDGLDDLRRIVRQAPNCLHASGWLLLEHGYDQAGAVRALLQARGFTQVQSRCDLAGIERCSGGRWESRGP